MILTLFLNYSEQDTITVLIIVYELCPKINLIRVKCLNSQGCIEALPAIITVFLGIN